MRIEPGFDKDPLAKPQHQVVSSLDGVHFTIIGTVDDPIELLRIEVEKNQLVGMKDCDVLIVNQKSGAVEERFDSYRTPPRNPDEPPTLEWLEIRDRWMDRVFKFLLPTRLYETRGDQKTQRVIRRWMRKHKIEISAHENGAVQIWRGGEILTAFE